MPGLGAGVGDEVPFSTDLDPGGAGLAPGVGVPPGAGVAPVVCAVLSFSDFTPGEGPLTGLGLGLGEGPGVGLLTGDGEGEGDGVLDVPPPLPVPLVPPEGEGDVFAGSVFPPTLLPPPPPELPPDADGVGAGAGGFGGGEGGGDDTEDIAEQTSSDSAKNMISAKSGCYESTAEMTGRKARKISTRCIRLFSGAQNLGYSS